MVESAAVDPASSPRKGPGRPSKFTEDTRQALLRGIRRGLHFEDACQAAGVSYQRFREWVAAGDADDPIYVEFSEAVHKAEIVAKRRYLRTINKAANDDWRPASWMLSRRWPDQYAEQRRGTVTHTGTIEVKHEHLLTGLDLDAVRGLLTPPQDPSIIDADAHEVPPEP